MKNWLIWKDSDTGKDWRQEEKGTTNLEMVGWHHQLHGHEFEQALGVGDGQGNLACCSPWVTKSLTQLSDWTELNNTMLQQLSWQPKSQLCKPLLHLPAILSFSHSLIHTYTHPSNYPLTHPSIHPSAYSPMHPSILPSLYLHLLLSFHPCFLRHFDGLKQRLYTKVLETQMSLRWLGDTGRSGIWTR